MVTQKSNKYITIYKALQMLGRLWVTYSAMAFDPLAIDYTYPNEQASIFFFFFWNGWTCAWRNYAIQVESNLSITVIGKMDS